RIVGDDAINRCIVALRNLARGYDPEPFHIETIRGVGYSLVAAPVAGTAVAEAPSVSPAAPGRKRRLGLALAGLTIVGVAAGAVGFLAWRHSTTTAPEPRIALSAFNPLDADPQSEAFAKRLTDEVAGVLNENVAGLAPPEPGQSPARADLRVGGTAEREGDMLRVRAYLEDGRDKVTLWSRRYELPAAEEDALRIQVAVDLSDNLLNAMEPLQQKGLRIDSRALALWLSATGVYRQGRTLGDPRIAARAYDQVVEKAPHFARARGMAAQAYAQASMQTPPAEAAELARHARAEAERALRDDPYTPEGAYDALFYLTRSAVPTDYARAEDIWAHGLTVAPNLTGGHMRRCEFLLDLGRAQAALPDCERAAALRPLGAPWGYRYARALAATGQAEKADEAIAREVRLHPQQWWIRQARFQMKAFSGPPAEAQALLRDAGQPPAFTAEQAQALEAFLRARISQNPADADRAIAQLRALADRHAIGREYLFKALVVLGRLDEAFGAAAPRAIDLGSAQGWLFEPGMEPAQRDPRFWDLAARLGLIRYWRLRGVWPDFCQSPDLGFDCATRAAQAAQRAGVS
ncbi:MAG TPA: hypothetical protein VF495_27725, partial [Phenylobacterium sp.]